MSQTLPTNFANANQAVSKQPLIVVKIDGVEDIITSGSVGTFLLYGDPVYYGGLDDAGNPWVYNGLEPWTSTGGGTVKQYLDLAGSNLTIDQRLEPEQGRCSVSQFTLSFIDKNGYFTNLCTPGNVVTEIMGRQVDVYMGYEGISYPEDFIIIYRGIIQGIQFLESRCVFQLGDCALKRRQQVFFTGMTTLSGGINTAVTTIPVANNSDFYARIIGPTGADDTSVKTYVQIDNEWIEYSRTGYGSNQFTSVTRGARGTTAASHSSGATVAAGIQLQGNPIDLILKIMLSGWNTFYKTGQTVNSIAYTNDPVFGNPTNCILLPSSVNAISDLGLAPGDRLDVVGGAFPANNVTTYVSSFSSVFGGVNNVISTTHSGFTMDTASTATLSLRSQYDTLPTLAGIKMYPNQIDVAGHQYYRNSIYANEQVRFFQTAQEFSAKDFMELQLNLPLSLYSINSQGKVGIKATLPPIAGQTLLTLDSSNVLDPARITISRGLSNRKFFNEIDISYDEDDSGNFQKIIKDFDSTSYQNIGQLSVLPIDSRATKSDLTSASAIQVRIDRMLNRYKNASIIIDLTVNFGTGVQIDIGDIVLLDDEDTLQIPNLSVGTRGLGAQMFEVIGRTLDVKTGRCALKLLSGITFTTNDRFATFAPSSYCSSAGNTTSSFQIIPSFGSIFGVDEYKKWTPYVGEKITLHNYSFSVSSSSVIASVSSAGTITVSPPLSFTPGATTIADLGPYSASGDPVQKLVHCFWDRTVPVVTGVSGTQFTVGAGDTARFVVGQPVLVHKNNYSVIGDEINVLTVVGTTVTLESNLGFTPDNTYSVELGAFADLGAPYRFL